MYKLKLFLWLLLTFSLLAPMPSRAIPIPDNPPPVSSTDPIIIKDYEPQEVFDGAMLVNNAKSKDEVLRIIQTQINLIARRASNNELNNLNRLPSDIRNNVLALNYNALYKLHSLQAEIDNETDLDKIKYKMQSSANAREVDKELATYNYQVLLLKNYNRLYNILQNSYQVINDALAYIDLHDSSSPSYGGQKPFSASVYNDEIAPLKQQLITIKTSQLDNLKNSLDDNVANLNNIAINGSIDEASVKVLEFMQLDLPAYKSNYDGNIKSLIVSNINQLVGIALNQQNENIEINALDDNFSFKIELTSYDAANKIPIISAVRTATGLGLTQAIDLVESAPITIKSGLTTMEVLLLQQQMENAGAVVNIYPPVPKEYSPPIITPPSKVASPT